jgi:hypothetical protein
MLETVAADPRWIPHTYDVGGSALTSVFVPREKHAELMFLSDEFYAGNYAKVTHPAADLAPRAAAAERAPIHFIFHTAFCCSTLMIKALDLPGRTLGLKEPDVMINVANRIAHSDDRANRQRLDLVLRLLERPFTPGETVIVKPSNFANRLMLPILEARPQAHAVLLYSDLATLLRSVAKRGIWGRIWARKLFLSARAWTSIDFSFGAAELFELTDLQIAGLGWLMQVHHFREARARAGGRAMVCDSANFIADPAATLERVSGAFGLDMHRPALDAIATGPVFSRHSKFAQRDYSVDAREAEHDAAVAAHGKEIEVVLKWIDAIAGHYGVSLDPSA